MLPGLIATIIMIIVFTVLMEKWGLELWQQTLIILLTITYAYIKIFLYILAHPGVTY